MSDSDRLMEYVSDYIEGNLSGDIKREFEARLQQDDELQLVVKRVRLLSQRLPAMAKITTTEAFDYRLQESLRGARATSSRFAWPELQFNWQMPAYATALVALLGVSYLFFDQTESPVINGQSQQEMNFSPNISGQSDQQPAQAETEEAEALRDSLGNEPPETPLKKKEPQLVNDRK